MPIEYDKQIMALILLENAYLSDSMYNHILTILINKEPDSSKTFTANEMVDKHTLTVMSTILDGIYDKSFVGLDTIPDTQLMKEIHEETQEARETVIAMIPKADIRSGEETARINFSLEDTIDALKNIRTPDDRRSGCNEKESKLVFDEDPTKITRAMMSSQYRPRDNSHDRNQFGHSDARMSRRSNLYISAFGQKGRWARYRQCPLCEKTGIERRNIQKRCSNASHLRSLP